jgi:multiple sugar transport system ATP-binding protein
MADLQLSKINKSYAGVPVLRDIDLEVADGDFVVFVGPSGCGKSTLLRVIAGLEDISSGDLRIGGTVVNDAGPAQRGIAMVFQSYALYPHMSVYENMAFGLKLSKAKPEQVDEAVMAAARILDIEHLLKRKPKDLSGGQRQRVAIGRAIVRKPKVFLFDEPLSNLDAALRVRMRYEFAKLHEDLKTTMIYVTHDQVEAMTLADRIVVLSAGRIEQVGTPMELYQHPDNMFVAGFIGSPRINFFPGEVVQAGPAGARVRLSSGEEVEAAVSAERAQPGDRVTLGVRPEHFEPGASSNTVSATVRFVESLGHTTFAYAAFPGTELEITTELPAEAKVRSGETLRLGVPARSAHLFDADGRAFRRLADSAAGAA